MAVLHPTGSEEFEARLAAACCPAPWRLDEDSPGEILAADGAFVLRVGDRTTSPDDDSAIAVLVMLAVNTLAGYRAEISDED